MQMVCFFSFSLVEFANSPLPLPKIAFSSGFSWFPPSNNLNKCVFTEVQAKYATYLKQNLKGL